MPKQDVLIEQPAGLGDILFCQKIAHRLEESDKYKNIYWPVSDVYKEEAKMIESPANFISPSDEYYQDRLQEERMLGEDQYFRLPLQRADQLVSNVTSLLTCKYEMIGLDWKDWSDYFSFERNYDKENDLFAHFKLDPDSKYSVLGQTCGSPPNQKVYAIDSDDLEERVIHVDMISGYSAFDWSGIFENATSIHMVDTCFVYIMEKLRLQTNKLHLYSRYHPADFSHIRDLLKVDWKYEEW